MDTNTKEATPATVSAPPAKTRTRLVKTPGSKAPAKMKAAQAPKAAKAEAPKVRTNVHVDAGVDTSAWTGPSDMLNKNRKVQIMQRANVTADDLTDRQKKSLYALRKAYAGRGFPAKGFDNGVMAFLAASGMLSLSGGQTATIDGKSYLVDGATPVIARVTAAGTKFGTV